MSAAAVDAEPAQSGPATYDEITPEQLAQADGSSEDKKCYIAIKGTVYDVANNKVYREGGNYHVFAGTDATRALAKSSTNAEDVNVDIGELTAEQAKTLDDWVTFFTKRYKVVGKLSGGAKNVSKEGEGAGGEASAKE